MRTEPQKLGPLQVASHLLKKRTAEIMLLVLRLDPPLYTQQQYPYKWKSEPPPWTPPD